MCGEARRLREGLTSLYLTIYEEVEEVQNTWFTNPEFDQFWVRPPADLVLSPQYNLNSEKDQRLKGCIDDISTVLQRLDEVLLFFSGYVRVLAKPDCRQISFDMFSDTIMQAPLRKILEPFENLRDTEFPGPVPYTISHPLPKIIRKFNDFMSGITVVFAQWAETGELRPLDTLSIY